MDLDLFDLFYIYHSGLFEKYDAVILRRVFDVLLDRISTTDEKSFPLSELENAVARDLAGSGIHCIGLAGMIREIMPFICEMEELSVDSFAMHVEDINRLSWSILARHVEAPARYSKRLANAVVRSFSKSGVVSTEDAFMSITAMKSFSEIPEEAIAEAIEAAYDYFVEKGLLAPD